MQSIWDYFSNRSTPRLGNCTGVPALATGVQCFPFSIVHTPPSVHMGCQPLRFRTPHRFPPPVMPCLMTALRGLRDSDASLLEAVKRYLADAANRSVGWDGVGTGSGGGGGSGGQGSSAVSNALLGGVSTGYAPVGEHRKTLRYLCAHRFPTSVMCEATGGSRGSTPKLSIFRTMGLLREGGAAAVCSVGYKGTSPFCTC